MAQSLQTNRPQPAQLSKLRMVCVLRHDTQPALPSSVKNELPNAILVSLKLVEQKN